MSFDGKICCFQNNLFRDKWHKIHKAILIDFFIMTEGQTAIQAERHRLTDRQTDKLYSFQILNKWCLEEVVFWSFYHRRHVLLLIKQRIFTFIVTIPFIIYSSKLPVHRRKNPLFQITFVLEYTRNISTIWKLIVDFCLMFNSSAFFSTKVISKTIVNRSLIITLLL